MKNKKLIKIALYAIIIAVYVALSLALGALSFGQIQIRVAEVLVIFCLASLGYTIPLTIACLITNVLGLTLGMDFLPLDFIFGTLATLISCLLAYYFRKKLWFDLPILSLLMPCIANGIIVGLELMITFDMGMIGFLTNFLFVFLGEFISCVLLGSLLYKPFLRVYQNFIIE